MSHEYGSQYFLNVMDQPDSCTAGCGACCVVCEIVADDGSILSEAGVACEHLTDDGMCAIYDERPAACACFSCLDLPKDQMRILRQFKGR